MALNVNDPCPKCRGRTLEIDPEGDIHCWACGMTIVKVPTEKQILNPEKGNEAKRNKANVTRQRKSRQGQNFLNLPANRKHLYIENNKDAIIADLLAFGRAAVSRKWDISESTIHTFERKHLTTEQKDAVTQIGIDIGRAKSPRQSDDGQMPPLPRFKDSWDVSVQLKWLNVYERLFVGNHPTALHGSDNNG